jgi:hypothetical protein
MHSEVEFLDIVYLGIFVILSPAFDGRFYTKKTPPALIQEAAYAVRHFQSLLHNFAIRHIIVLAGVAVAHSYVVDRLLAEFAAASVVFAKAIHKSQEDEGYGNGEIGDGVTFSMFAGSIEHILQESYPKIFSYFSSCLDSGHKHFTWKGPQFMIFPRSDSILDAIHFATAGELLDLPEASIYGTNSVPLATTVTQIGKRQDPAEVADVMIDHQAKKQRR